MQLRDFNTYIQQLLFDYDCVIIPGFGGLVAQPHPAQVNSITKQIYPRSKKIAFNQNLLTNDGLLAEYISRKEKCTYAEAILKIQETVKELQHRLAEKNTFELDGIGSFRFDAENKLIFSVQKNESFLYDSFGLKPVKAVPLNLVSDKPKIMEKEEEIVPVTADAEAEPETETTEEKAVRRKRKVSIPFIAVSVLVIAFAGLTMYLASQNATLPFLHNDGSQTASFIDSSSESAAATEESTPAESTEAESSSSESNTEEVPATTESSSASTENTTSSSEVSQADAGYYIIAGAFGVEENAAKLLTTLKESGYNNAQLAGKTSSGGLLRVAYLKADNLNEAETKLSEIKDKSLEGWILKIK
jgi:cell division septation protein DedD